MIKELLIKYIRDKKISIQGFADSIGYTRIHLSNIIHGKCPISKRMEKVILEKISNKSFDSIVYYNLWECVDGFLKKNTDINF